MVAQRRLSPPSLLLQVPHSSSFSRPLERAESIAVPACCFAPPLCVRVCLARRKMSPISLSLSLVACIGSVVCRTCPLSFSPSLPYSLSFRHSFHKFIAQQIACEVSDAQEQKEATCRPHRRWTHSLSERTRRRASGRQTTRQIDLKYCITHAPQTLPDIQFHEDEPPLGFGVTLSLHSL